MAVRVRWCRYYSGYECIPASRFTAITQVQSSVAVHHQTVLHRPDVADSLRALQLVSTQGTSVSDSSSLSD